jgi:protein-tyrosine phosphatase
MEMPLLVVDTYRPTAEAALDLLDDPDAVAVAVGTLTAEGRPTAIAATERGYEIVEPGLLAPDEIEKLAARIVLFICTGNTCRSPLAEGLAKRMLAERLGCTVAELPRRGVWVLSAGVSACDDHPATPEAAAVASEQGADLGEHRSRAVNAELLDAADDVIAMTRGHAQALASRFPGSGPAPRLLCGDEDLDDPIGSGLDVYRLCAATIRTHLERFLPEWTGQ